MDAQLDQESTQDFDIEPTPGLDMTDEALGGLAASRAEPAPESSDLEGMAHSGYEALSRDSELEKRKLRRDMEDSRKRKTSSEAVRGYSSPVEYLDSVVRKGDTKLKANLSRLIHQKKQRLEARQYTGIKRLLKYVGYKAAPISDDKALEHVVTGLIRAAETTTERKRIAKEQRKKIYEQVRAELRTMTQNRNKDYDLYHAHEKRLESVELELTQNYKARDEHLTIASQSGYNGEVDSLIEKENEKIEELTEEMEELKENMSELSDNLSDYQRRMGSLSRDGVPSNRVTLHDKLMRSRSNYELAKEAYQRALTDTQELVDFRKNETERQSLIDFYRELAQDQELFKNIGVVIETSDEVTAEIFRSYMEEQEQVQGSRATTPAGEYMKKKELEREEMMEHIKAERFQLHH